MSIRSLLVLTLTVLAAMAWSRAVFARETPAHVWFGTFVNTQSDGRFSHGKTAHPNQASDDLSGCVGSSIDLSAPILDGHVTDDGVSFRIDGCGGIAFVLYLNAGDLVGTAKGRPVNAVLDLVPVPGLMLHDRFVAEIMAADTRCFAAYDGCDHQAYKATLSPDLEFIRTTSRSRTGKRCRLP